MTVAEIGWFAAGFHPDGQTGTAAFQTRYAALVEGFGLPAKRKIKALSKGMKAKVSLSLALASDPPLLVLDEPTSGLDTMVRREFLESMVDLASTGRTVLLSSHQIAEVERVASHVALIHQGQADPGRAARRAEGAHLPAGAHVHHPRSSRGACREPPRGADRRGRRTAAGPLAGPRPRPGRGGFRANHAWRRIDPGRDAESRGHLHRLHAWPPSPGLAPHIGGERGLTALSPAPGRHSRRSISMVARLWWKDARQFWPIWALLAVVALAVQGLALHYEYAEARQGGMAVAALFWACLYGFAVAAAAFAGERETRTLGLLDALPVERWRLWLAKSSFALVSTLALGLVLFAAASLVTDRWQIVTPGRGLVSGRTRAARGALLGPPLVGGHQQRAAGRGAGDQFGIPDPASLGYGIRAPGSARTIHELLTLAIGVVALIGSAFLFIRSGPPRRPLLGTSARSLVPRRAASPASTSGGHAEPATVLARGGAEPGVADVSRRPLGRGMAGLARDRDARLRLLSEGTGRGAGRGRLQRRRGDPRGHQRLRHRASREDPDFPDESRGRAPPGLAGQARDLDGRPLDPRDPARRRDDPRDPVRGTSLHPDPEPGSRSRGCSRGGGA